MLSNTKRQQFIACGKCQLMMYLHRIDIYKQSDGKFRHAYIFTDENGHDFGYFGSAIKPKDHIEEGLLTKLVEGDF